MITIPLWSMVMNVSVKSISFIFTCFVLNIWNSCYKIVFVSIMYILENWCARYIRKPKVMGIIVCLVYILLYIWFQNNTCVARCIPQDLKHQQSTLTDEICYYFNKGLRYSSYCSFIAINYQTWYLDYIACTLDIIIFENLLNIDKPNIR